MRPDQFSNVVVAALVMASVASAQRAMNIDVGSATPATLTNALQCTIGP